MVAPLTPTGIKTQGNVKWVFNATSSLTAPSVATWTAAGALDVSNIFYADSGRHMKETAKGPAPRRVGTTKVWQQTGTDNESFGDLRYVVDPQGAAASDGKKAWEKFPPGTVGYFLERLGLSVDTDLAIGQWARVIPVKIAARNFDYDTTDEFGEIAVVQSVIVTAPGAGELVQMVA